MTPAGGRALRGLRRRHLFAALLAAPLPACARTAEPPLATRIPPFALPPGSALRSLGGLELDREQLGFGGLSALHVAPDLTLTALSDRARWLTAQLGFDAGDGLAGFTLLRTGRLADQRGAALRPGAMTDSEALVRLPDGSWLVAFERWHRIRRYRTLDGPAEDVEAPPGIETAPANGGLESLGLLADGRLLAIAEKPLDEDPTMRAAWLGGPGRWMRVAYRPAPGMDPTDAAGLPDGGALVLERGFSLFGGFTGRLLRVSAAALREAAPGSVLQGEALLRLAPPLPTDNWEGVAVTPFRDGLLVLLVSDDNERSAQRTLLLAFLLGG